MGGVDVHDQLRLQRYSLQRAVTFLKKYKSLFLGLVDLKVVNGYHTSGVPGCERNTPFDPRPVHPQAALGVHPPEERINLQHQSQPRILLKAPAHPMQV